MADLKTFGKLEMQSATVWSIRRDSDETLWISSALGLHRLKGTEHLSITVTNGLPGQNLRCSAQTRDGIIWMGSDDLGLLGYDGKAVTLLDARDGFRGHGILSLLRDVDDSLWVGTGSGGLVHTAHEEPSFGALARSEVRWADPCRHFEAAES